MELWHNPRCSKSRAAKAILDERGVAYTERSYLDEPPTAAELDRVLTALDLEPWQLARLGEPMAAELGREGTKPRQPGPALAGADQGSRKMNSP